MAISKMHAIRVVLGAVLAAFLLTSCSTSDPVQPRLDEAAATADLDEDAESVSSTDDEASSTPTATPAPTLADDDVASVADLQAGEQAKDSQGNLIAVYGVSTWPSTFEALTDASQAEFPFFGDVADLGNAAVELVALDVGICTAGIDVTNFGTAEFFVHESAEEVLSTDPVLNRAVLARHPIVQPGFDFPAPAECSRGWLPVAWSGTEAPATARYVLTTRSSASAEIDRYVYQWELDEVDISNVADEVDADSNRFAIGQTVTFNSGPLAETTVMVDGWTELVGADSSIEGTRMVAVSLSFCPSSVRLPEFGLSIDNWNLVAPIPGNDLLGAMSAADPTQNCFDGWLEFAVPFGGVPTGFFASDGLDSVSGYAEWSLDNAALATPQ